MNFLVAIQFLRKLFEARSRSTLNGLSLTTVTGSIKRELNCFWVNFPRRCSIIRYSRPLPSSPLMIWRYRQSTSYFPSSHMKNQKLSGDIPTNPLKTLQFPVQ